MKKSFFYAKIKKIDILDGDEFIIVINSDDAARLGIHAMDKVAMRHKGREIVLNVDTSTNLIPPGVVGILQDVSKKYDIEENESVEVEYARANPISINAIRKKLLGEKLTEKEIKSIVQDIQSNRLSDTHVTYFTACWFFYKSVNDELVRMTKATAETGNTFHFPGVVASKYSIGGVPSNETSMIVVPLLASLGIKVAKSFSKAITSPAATGECVSVLMNINFTPAQVKKLVKKHNCCLVRSEPLNLAPANDKIIKVSNAISLEPYSRMISSIMAKQYAMGITHCLIELPIGPTAKIPDLATAKRVKRHFAFIGNKIGMKVEVLITNADQPIGKGVWAALQVREVLDILQQKESRSINLEEKALLLSKEILELTGYARWLKAYLIAKEALTSGKARKKMQEIIKAQWWKNNIKSGDITVWKLQADVLSKHKGIITSIDMKHINTIARTLGCPYDDQAWLILHKKLWDNVEIGEKISTLFSNQQNKLSQTLKMLKKQNIYKIRWS